ncbi:bifunctional 3'-5' exonuclease/ATP-dependent helicase WRN isoform X3 [Leucoraja erinacea]|uniref:bifunctional 3'-5' exonuclease/ATP-dependent helicase WRN isoform X3 n=1 Tax=Leucoraja erinaceus TaxID=7782 RepID=UPI002457D7E0|nr:bifunctional 3'-5' exonuclease/ATP-dependent helicase WRN isoform X3 [Leucoraja erinacea]
MMTDQQRKLPEWMASEEIKETNTHLQVSCIKNCLEDKLPFLEFHGSIIYSHEGNDCSFLSEDLRLSIPSDSAIGFDIEWPPTYTKGKEKKVALIQLCAHENKCYLFHVSSMSGFPSGLKRLLEDEAIKKVGVGIEGDHWKLMRDYDIKLKGFVELSEVANKKFNYAEKWSLNGLVKHLYGKQLWKDTAVRCSDWDAFPLSNEQQQYAAVDAYAGLLIYQKLSSLDLNRGKQFQNKDDQKLLPSAMLKSDLVSIAHDMQDLAEMVPDFHINGVQRATDVLNVISENVSALRNILIESTSGIDPQPGNETKTELLADNRRENECTENSLEMIEMTNRSHQEQASKADEADLSCVIESDEELENEMINASKVDEADLSCVIESDEELENEMIKVLENVDSCSEQDSEESLSLLGKTVSEELFGLQDEEDERIEEEEEKWDTTIPEPNENQIKCLKTYFGHSNFKPVQWNIIYSVLQERRDNLVVMATGYGKSLCYQFPAVYTGGVAIVISPLISLMEDQVLQLNMSNITACFLGSAQSQKFSHELIKGHFKVIYMTPEYCSQSTSLLKKLDDTIGITVVAVDEAHCISEWGHDFRNSYRKLGSLKQLLPQVPIVALTATASPSIRSDIIENLKMTNPRVVCTTFDRPNLYLEVGRKSTDIGRDLKPFLITKDNDRFSLEFEGPTIVYCPSRKTTEHVAGVLSQMNVVCGTYHAGMGIKARRDVHHKFMRDEIQCVVATIAFGMGINKPDIRKVIHYGAPKEMESYYQEIGRAGRDGLASACHVLWSPSDITFNRHLLNDIKNLRFRNYKIKMMEKIKQYLASSKCRRNIILSHFEDEKLRKATLGIIGTDRCCDNCKSRIGSCTFTDEPENEMQDFGKEVYQLLTAICILGERFGIGVPVLFLRGSYSQRLPEQHRNHHLFGSGKNNPESWWKALGHLLIIEGFLQENNICKRFAVTTALSMKGRKWFQKAADESCRTLSLPATEELRPQALPKVQFQPSTSPAVSLQRDPALVTQSELQIMSLGKQFGREKIKGNERSFDTSAIKGSPIKTVPSEPVPSARELELQGKLYGKLLAARQNIANAKDVPPAILATNKILLDFAKIRPSTLDNLKRIDGVSLAKAAVLAPLLYIIKEFCKANEFEVDKFSISKLNEAQNPVVQPNSALGPQFNVAHVSKARTSNSSNMIAPTVVHHSSYVPKSDDMDGNQTRLGHPVQELNIKSNQNHLVQSDFNWESVQRPIDDKHPGQPQSSSVETKFPKANSPAPRIFESFVKDWIETAGKHVGSSHEMPISVPLVSLESLKQPTASTKMLSDDFQTPENHSDTEKPAVAPCSQSHTDRSCQKNVSSVSFASWNDPMIDASDRDLFDDSQSESQSAKRKLPEWFGSSKPLDLSSTAVKKAKKKKGLFN